MKSILVLICWGVLSCMPLAGGAADLTTGAVTGIVTDLDGRPVVDASVTASAPAGRGTAQTDAQGRFIILGLAPDSYAITARARGFAGTAGTTAPVLAGQTRQAALKLGRVLPTIGRVKIAAGAFAEGSPSDSFTVTGAQARAQSPPVSSPGLANYLAGTVQGALAAVPGVALDQFANAIMRGGKVSDAVFDYDSVPVPQGLVAEPGGNIVGAQLPATGVASTTATLAGYTAQGENALGGIVDQIAAVGTYPASGMFETSLGVSGGQMQRQSLMLLGATPDLRWRYAFAAASGSDYFRYGDGRTFYPSEAGTYGLALQNRGDYSIESNLHYRIGSKDDVSVLGLAGQAAYDLYGSPFAGETAGEFDGRRTAFPGEAGPAAAVTAASGVRGTYGVAKAQWLHTGEHSLSRVQLYQSQYGSQAGGPFWDENGWPDGSISLSQTQGAREEGIGYDGESVLRGRHDTRFGAGYRTNTSFLEQVVPTADERISSNPTLISYLAYLGDTWSVAPRFDLMGTARLTDTRIVPSNGSVYSAGALDPHAAAVYKFGGIAFRATYDHISVAPQPLEADRVDSSNVQPDGSPAPFVPLSPERAANVTYSAEGGGRVAFRATAYSVNESNLIDVLPYNFRSALQSGLVPAGVGVPSNVGALRARGLELWLDDGGVKLDANYDRAASSSASQFAYNDLNAPAAAAGRLFPVSYIPNFSANLSREFRALGGRLRVTPSVSFESGYPYGNGKEVWVFDPATNKPEEVPNDNHVDPGFNYYFLKDPAVPYNAVSNPYIGTLGTVEGDTPNTLHAPPQTFVNVRVEGDVAPRLSLILDVVNVFGNFSATSYQGNPYLIGPPGYAGGNPAYESAYAGFGGYSAPYTLGNGVPTNDGRTQSVPWTYGRGGYVPQGYPLGRTVGLRLRYHW